jgi:deoxyadenosine/deoxycytidine kinase
MQCSKSNYIITIEGNIGAGKSTFLKRFINDPYVLEKLGYQVCLIEEPVGAYRDVAGHNMLDVYYEDPIANAFRFQVMASTFMGGSILNANRANNIVTLLDRGPHSCEYFTELQKDNKSISLLDYTLLKNMYQMILHKNLIDCVFVINTEPSVCAERIIHRNRTEERMMKLDYLINAHNMIQKILPPGYEPRESYTIEGKMIIYVNSCEGYIHMRDKLIRIIETITGKNQ